MLKKRVVQQLNLDGTLVKQFNTAKEAETELGVCDDTIARRCRIKNDRSPEYRGFIWRYETIDVEPEIKANISVCINKKKAHNKVLKYSLDGELIKEYENVSEAAMQNGVSESLIIQYCLGNVKNCKAYIWKYKKHSPLILFKNGIVKIELTNGQFAKIDESDLDKVKDYVWFAHYNNCTNSYYAHSNTKYIKGQNRKTVAMHRLIMGVDNSFQVDHVNHDTLDNTRSNLRICTRQENAMNRKPYRNCKSKYKGVKPNNYGKWVACIECNKKHYYLGTFITEKEAALAYNNKVIELHGEFAYLNVIKD